MDPDPDAIGSVDPVLDWESGFRTKKSKGKGEEISINDLTVIFFIFGHHKPGSGPIPDSPQSLLPDSVPDSDPEH